MTEAMKQARDNKARTYGYNNAIYIDKAMLNKEGYQYLEEKPAKDFKEGTDWYRNNVWHPISKKPGTGKIAVSDDTNNIQTMDITKPLEDSHWNMIIYDRPHIINKWAYVEDLLPDNNRI